MTHAPFELELPSRPEFLGTARTFVGSLARRLEVDDEVTADLELVVSEACSDALEAGMPMRVRASTEAGSFDVEVTVPDETVAIPRGAGSLDGAEAVRAHVIRSLFPDATFETSSSGRTLRVSVPVG